MSFKIKRVFKINNYSHSINTLDSTVGVCSSGPSCTSGLYPSQLDLVSTSQAVANPNINIDPDGDYIYTIAWYANSVSHKSKNDENHRNIYEYIPVPISGIPDWPPVAQISGTSGPTGPQNFYFGYMCANGSLVYDFQACKCSNGSTPQLSNLGLCTGASGPGPNGAYGPSGPTPYNNVATIKILTDNYYKIQMILDTFSPACCDTKNSDGSYNCLPDMEIYVYQDATYLGDTSKATLIATNYDKTKIGSTSFSLNGQQWAIWYPNKNTDRSLVAPIPQPTDDNTGTVFYNQWPLYNGNIIQFILINRCKNPGNFSGTIRLTPHES